MTYSIIGSGNVGTALATQFARSGIAFGMANTRGPGSISALAQQVGALLTPLSLHEALRADVIILAVPFRAHAVLGKALADWSGKIIVDATNAYGVPVEELQGQPSSEIVAAAFPGASVVKTFNQLPARVLALNPAEGGGRRVMFVSSNDEASSVAVSRLVTALGFAPLALGKIRDGGALLALGGPLLLQNIIKFA